MLPHTYIQYTLHIFTSDIYIFSTFMYTPFIIYIFHTIYIFSPFLKLMPKIYAIYYIVMPKCDKKFECTFKNSFNVLSQFSCNTLHVCNATWTSTNSSIMWSAIEKLWSWMGILACAICFYNASMFGRIMPYMFTNVALILASSLSNSTCILVRNLIF